MLFAVAVLVLAFTLIKGESAWLAVHNFLFGMFGSAVFLVPVVLIYTSVMVAGDKTGQHIKGKLVQCGILIVILCAALRIFGMGALPEDMKLGQMFIELYESGRDKLGGGLMSIFLGQPLMALFGKTGAGIIIVLLAFVWIMLIANKTIVDLFRMIKGLIYAAADAREDYKEVEEPVRRHAPDKDEFREPPGAKRSRMLEQKKLEDDDIPEEILRENRDNFNIDIEIPSKNGKKTKKEQQKEKTEQEANEIARVVAANEAAKNAARTKNEEHKQNAENAKASMNEASGDLDELIKKAAASRRAVRQSSEKEQSGGLFGLIKKPAEKAEASSENTAGAVQTAQAPAAESAASNTAASSAGGAAVQPAQAQNTQPVQNVQPVHTSAPSAPVNNAASQPLRNPVHNQERSQKASTLASNKIVGDEDLDMPETMTAQDIQKEIIAEAKPVYEYNFPPIDLLKPSHNDANSADAELEMKANADTLVNTLKSFGVMTRIVDIHRGPTVTRYELQPSAGVKISKITNLADDIALNLAAEGVRIEAPIPGKAAVGIEVPNRIKDTVTMRDIIDTEEFKNAKSKLTFAVGKNIDGDIVLGDISKLPHIIIAGTTGSGKSVCTNGIIMSILYNATPDEVRLVLIDPKVVEFKIYDGIPHLLIPVVTDPRKAAGALAWAVQEMLKRYKLFADNNVRDINGYNEKAQSTDGMEPLPRIVIIIDELADLMMAAAGEVEDSICRLAQMARAAGMHLIIATQRPTVDVITGLIKANIPSRIALKVASGIDSRSIINEIGAEKLLGQGDLLYFPTGFAKPVRVQNCFTSDKEVSAVVDYIKNGAGSVEYDEGIMSEIENNIPVPKGEKPADNGKSYDSGSDDDLVERAIECVIDNGQCSTSYLQRKLKLGYARAARIVDELEEMGVVGPQDGAKPRQILMSRETYLCMKNGGTAPVTYYDNTPSAATGGPDGTGE